MAHEIFEHDTMVSAGNETPWHRLGTVHDGDLSLDEAFETVKMGWTVSKHQAFTRVNRAETFEQALSLILPAHMRHPELSFSELLVEIGFDLLIEDKFATVREDIPLALGVVGKDYTCFQNSAGYELVRALLSGGDIKIETAGTLNNGRRVWVLARLDKDMSIAGDEHVPYLLFVWSHDGTTGLRILPTPVRVVCGNTMRMALAGAKSSWKTSHTKGIQVRAAEIAETLKLTWKYYEEFEAEVRKLVDLTVPEIKFEDVLSTVIPDPKPDAEGNVSERKLNNALDKRGQIRHLYNNSELVGEFKGTGWGVVQAFNVADLWLSRVHGGEGMRAERQADRILAGDTMANTSQVRELLLAA